MPNITGMTPDTGITILVVSFVPATAGLVIVVWVALVKEKVGGPNLGALALNVATPPLAHNVVSMLRVTLKVSQLIQRGSVPGRKVTTIEVSYTQPKLSVTSYLTLAGPGFGELT